MTRSRSLSLSVALHGALLLGLAWLGAGRAPQETPAGIAVVWVEAGLSDLAAQSRGDAGVADASESDPAGQPVPEPVTAEADDNPAPQLPDALDPVSGADRPAPAPTEPADENRRRVAETDAPEGDRAADVVARPTDAGAETPAAAEAPAVAEEQAVAAEPGAAVARADASAEARAEPAPEAPPEPTPEAATNPAVVRADASAETRTEPTPEAPPEPVAADEREMLRDEVMDWINRSRDFPSKASVAWSDDGHEYRAELTRVLSAGAMGIEEAVIEISTERDGRHLSTEMRVKRLAFSHYAQLIDRWDPEVQIHDDVIDGRFHSNTEILVANSGGIQPVFHGKVTTTSGIDTTRSSRRVRRSEVFLGGLETRVPRIALPKRFAPLEAIASEAADVIAVGTDSRITFAADGTYEITPVGDGAPKRGTLGSSPVYFVAAEKTAVAVEGVVNGKVLVYSPTEIVIEGDLVYAADPTREDADDYLGLVSDGTVEIADPDVTGPGDLTVHAAIYAKRRFAVRRYSRGERATLSIYGSVTAGSLTATEPRYRTKLEFDPRLENARPPSFPMTDRYELASWDGAWRVDGE